MAVDKVRRGYKRTEVGIIPEDWNVRPLAELFDLKNGLNADIQNYGHGTPFANVLEVITHTNLHLEQIPGRVQVSPDLERRFVVERGDVLFNRTSETEAEIGLASVYLSEFPIVFGGFVIRGRPKDESFVEELSAYCLRVPCVRQQVIARGQGAIRSNIGQADLATVLVPVPSKAEQERISETVQDVSSLIHHTEELLAKKRALKQGTMQELLSGKTRVPGFSADWEVKRLDMLADIRSGGTPNTSISRYWNGTIPWCTPTDITALGGAKYLNETERRITESGLQFSSAEMVPAKSIVMTSRATIGECAITTAPMSTNQGFKNFVPVETVDTEFLYYLLLTLKRQFISVCGGSTFLEIGRAQIAAIEARLPVTKSEQSAIANVLSNMDAEIVVFGERLAKYREIKQGMMQNLLTGATRFV